MAELMMSNTVKAIIALGVIVITIFIFGSQANAIFKSLRGYDDLKQVDKDLIDTNINNFIDIAKECRKISDDTCLCPNALKNFPDTFRKEINFEIKQDKNAEIIPKYGKNPIEGRNGTIEMAGFSYVLFTNDINDILIKDRAGLKSILLDFEYNTLKAGADFYLISGDLYKGESKSTLYFIVWSGKGTQVSEKEFFSNFPQCFDKRKEAIAQFDAFVAELKSLDKDKEITVNLTENYHIFYGGGVLKLEYNNEDVKKYDNKAKKSETVQSLSEFNVKCEQPAIKDYLASGSKINVTKTAEGFCIKRI